MEANYIAGTPYVGADVKMYAGPGGNRGVFTAWDPVSRRKVWEIKEDLPLWSPALATAGGLVFYGTMDGWFKAVDARTGKLLWQFKAGSGIIGQPISYRGPDGRQYIAVVAGVGGWAGAIVVGRARPARPDRGARLRQRGQGPADARPPREGCSMSSRFRASLARRLALAALALARATARSATAAAKPVGETVPAGESPDTIFPGERHAAAARPARHAYDSNAPAIAEGQQLYTPDELRRLPQPRRRRHGPGADGRQMALRRPHRPDRRDHRRRPARTACRRGAAR